MVELTLQALVEDINQLPRNQSFRSVGGRSEYILKDVVLPEGPVIIQRGKNTVNISTNQLALVATACANRPNYPLHIDRLFSAGGNTRSVLETILVHTPHFFVCFPQRANTYTGELDSNQRHFMWCPDDSHPIGEVQEKIYESIISEIEVGVDFGDIQISSPTLEDEFENIDVKRTHIQIQIALIEIGRALNFQTWIAKNDQANQYNGAPLSEHPTVLQSLDKLDILYNHKIRQAAEYVDCIWFAENRNRIPAVIEVEHSTGVTSGMTRMQKLQSTMPSIKTQYVVVAPNRLRNKVVTEANQPIFKNLNVGYMPYSTVRELYGLIQKYQLKDVVDYQFIQPFIEMIVI